MIVFFRILILCDSNSMMVGYKYRNPGKLIDASEVSYLATFPATTASCGLRLRFCRTPGFHLLKWPSVFFFVLARVSRDLATFYNSLLYYSISKAMSWSHLRKT